MFTRAVMIVALFCPAAGCLQPRCKMPVVNQVVAPYEQYVAKNFDWSTVQRIVIMPLANQTPYPRIGFEMQANLAAELQRAGRFEIVTERNADHGAQAADVFASGRFNEIEILRIAREHQADAVLFVNVTQYHPYARPRVGLSMLMISPAEGIAIASLSGLWDAREITTSVQAQAYFRQSQNWPRSLLGTERVFESPDVFQRFVCQQVAGSFAPSPDGLGAISTMLPPEVLMPVDGTMPPGMELPASPPASLETE